MARLSPITIGPATIDMPVILAPMTGVTDMPFRTLVRRYGSGLNVTEMIASPAMIRQTRQSLQKAAWHPVEEPVSGRGDHRHQHGLSGEEGRQRRCGQRADA
jgi:tRNA-dihydrouridine synthase B